MRLISEQTAPLVSLLDTDDVLVSFRAARFLPVIFYVSTVFEAGGGHFVQGRAV
jgi:hypothetical protein